MAGIDYGAMIAQQTGAKLLLLMVLGPEQRDVLGEFASHEGIALSEAAEAYLSRAATRAVDDVDVETQYRMDGNPADAILDHVEENDVSLIVMASHGRSGIRRWLLGSVAEKVIQSSPVPALVVPVRDL